MKVLYVEDDPLDSDLLLKHMHTHAPQVGITLAGCLSDALKCLEKEDAFDMALTDVRLPDGNGLDLLKDIRGRKLSIAVVVLTGSGDVATVVAALKAGADDYVIKIPGYVEQLPRIMEDALVRFREESGRRSRPLRVIYAEPNTADVDSTKVHFSQHAPHIRIEAINTAQAAEKRLMDLKMGVSQGCDVLLLNDRLPGTNAMDLIKTLRQQHGIRIPAVLITGQGSEETAAQALRLGFADYLTKAPGYLYKMPGTLENAYNRAQLARERNRLWASEEKYRILVENAAEMIFVVQEGRIRFANAKSSAATGYAMNEILGAPIKDFIHPDDLEEVIERHRPKLKGMPPDGGYTFRMIHQSGQSRWMDLNAVPIDWEGRPANLNFASDVTERVHAEEERSILEAQFRQAQKMEAVGRLAGGVAHDFNNMLSVINGYAHIALEKLNDADPLYADINEILKAGERSANLTRQLLAFARKQNMIPAVLNLNRIIDENQKMLNRLIGEDIRLTMALNPKLWRVKMDPSQVDQILANLSVNSRDAIKGVGNITIETDNVNIDEEYSRFHPELKPGQFAVLAFGDTGCGMDKETQAKIFEPFFTTKEENIGTGLGLSTVYGIAKQNGGGVNVYSEPGYGTIIRIYIPRFVGEETPIALSETVRQLTGNETILVVEDEEQIMRLCQRMLERNGYTVIAVDKPGEAIVLCEKHPGPIHLLVTDVIMPSMDGKELNDRIKAMQPDVRTLYMSGYTANIIASRGIQAEGDYFIQKPLSPKAFLTKIREILDSQPAEKKGLGMK